MLPKYPLVLRIWLPFLTVSKRELRPFLFLLYRTSIPRLSEQCLVFVPYLVLSVLHAIVAKCEGITDTLISLLISAADQIMALYSPLECCC